MRRLTPLVLLLVLVLAACDSGAPEFVDVNSTVTVAYEGRLTDGRVFDSSPRATFPLQNVIPGFRDGIVGMRVGETRTFEVPPEEGYGNAPPQGSIIPPSATLIFTVEILGIR